MLFAWNTAYINDNLFTVVSIIYMYVYYIHTHYQATLSTALGANQEFLFDNHSTNNAVYLLDWQLKHL